MSTNDTKYDLFKAELSLAQGQMDKYDQLSSTTKTWAITLWAASVGWAVQTHVPVIALLGGVSTVLFWFLDAYIMMFRLNYKDRRNIAAEALKTYSEKGEFAGGLRPLDLPTHDNGGMARSFFLVHLSLPYVALAALVAVVFALIS